MGSLRLDRRVNTASGSIVRCHVRVTCDHDINPDQFWDMQLTVILHRRNIKCLPSSQITCIPESFYYEEGKINTHYSILVILVIKFSVYTYTKHLIILFNVFLKEEFNKKNKNCYVVRNAGCARSRYTMKLSLIF